MNGDMDKEKEVKLYQPKIISESEIIDPITISKKRYLAFVSEIKRADDAEEALKAERTKREEAEKRLRGYEDAPDRLINIVDLELALAIANAKIVELEDNLKVEKMVCESRGVALQDLNNQFHFLESTLAIANAKIVELEKHDCEKFIDEGMGCSICSNLHLDLNKAKEIQDHVNWRISRLESELSTANKKAEKLVEALEKYGSHIGNCLNTKKIGCICGFKQALKELRGEV